MRLERKAGDRAVQMLRGYINALKEIELGGLICEKCGSIKNLELHHLRYGVDVNYYDLKLLCRECHRNIHHPKII